MGLFGFGKSKEQKLAKQGFMYYNMAKNDPYRRVEYLNKSVELGDPHGMSGLAKYYLERYYHKKDYMRKAEQLLLTAIDKGVLIEYEDLAQVYMHLDEKEKEFEYHKKAAEQGNSWGIYCVGCCYDKGRGTEADPKKAAEWYKKAMELGVDAAYNNMGILYKEGRGVEKDREAALECFIKAADMDNKAACGNAAVMLLSKKSSVADDMARKYAEKSRKSSKESQYVLAVLKAEGRGEWPNMPVALKMLEELMERRYEPAEKAYYKYIEDIKNPGEEAEKLYQDGLKEGDEDYFLDAALMGHIKACEKYLDILYNSVFSALYEDKILYERTVRYAPNLYEILKNGGIDYPKEKFNSILILFSQIAKKLIKADSGYDALRLLKTVEKYDDLHCKYMMIHAYHAIAEDYNAKAVIKEVMARTDVPDWMMEECRKNLVILKDE